MLPVVKYFKGRDPPVDDLGGGVIIESDCEVDSQGAENGPLKEDKTRAVLTMGSFSAYVDFYYMRPSQEKYVTNYPVGHLFSSTVAQIQSHSLPSSRRA